VRALTHLVGGEGNDTYIIDNSNDVIVEDGSNNDIVKSYVSYTLSNNLENLYLIGLGNLTGTGNSVSTT
jgi:Ca2+-binding RTX toxin-like protein